jgi:hypothetical protein
MEMASYRKYFAPVMSICSYRDRQHRTFGVKKTRVLARDLDSQRLVNADSMEQRASSKADSRSTIQEITPRNFIIHTYSEEPATWSYPELHESNPHPQTIFV